MYCCVSFASVYILCRRFPEYAHADHVHVTIEPGDLLVVPPYWWHAVESLSPALSVSVRVDRTSWTEIVSEMLDTLHVVGLWPLPWWGGGGSGCTCHRESRDVGSIEQLQHFLGEEGETRTKNNGDQKQRP